MDRPQRDRDGEERMMPEIAAIPTMYRGVRFRSRLEARWACFFNSLGYRWSYEALELTQYVPDFTIEEDRYDGNCISIVEVKPISHGRVFTEVSQPGTQFASDNDELARDRSVLREACAKIERAGWPGESFVVGVDPSMVLWNGPSERGWHRGQFVRQARHFDWQAAWAHAGNMTQWRRPPAARDAGPFPRQVSKGEQDNDEGE